ncbi:MAG TPA: LysR family transcriptional regulator [Bryobacteraceae bacterium]|nr:LysR family transcriptional regulator [Bryobacteraceae bacterium]
MTSSIESFRLAVFRTVAECLSFTQAAERLHLSQPAVTSHIKVIEEELAVRLFERSSGGIRLTPAGERLFTFALEAQRLAQQALASIGALTGECLGRLRVGASTTIAQYVLPGLLAEFRQLHSRVDLSVVSANTADIVAEMLARRIDLGLIEGPAGATDVKVETFVPDEIVVIAGESHVFAAGECDTLLPEDLTAEPLLLRERGSGTRRVVEDALREAGVDLRLLCIVMELDSTEAIKSGAEAGLGVGFVSRWALRSERASRLRIIPVRGLKIIREFQFIYPLGPEPAGAAGAFLRLARQYRQPYSTLPVPGPSD